MKSLGAAAAGLVGASGTVLASHENNSIPESVHLNLLKQRRYNQWDANTWRKKIAERGYDFKYQDYSVTTSQAGTFETTDQGQPETVQVQKYDPLADENDFEPSALKEYTAILRLTMVEGNGGKYLDFDWSVDDGWLSFAEPPHDYASFSFEPSLYDFDVSFDTKFGWEAYAADSVSALGPGYRVASFYDNMAAYKSTGRFGSWIDAKIRETTYKPPSRRNIYAEYAHRWTGLPQLTGVSAGTSGALVFSSNTGMWRAETVATEAAMSDGNGYDDYNPY